MNRLQARLPGRLVVDHRAGAWPRALARRRQYAFVRRHVWFFLVFLAASIIPVCLLTLFIPSRFARGFVIGAVTAAAVAYVVVWVLQATGTTPTMMGERAERWTADELRRLRRRGWRLVNHFALDGCDVDHVLVGPGGVLAVETKWSAEPWALAPPQPRVLTAVDQVQRAARSLRLWSPIKKAGIDVSPVLVLWATGMADAAGPQPVQRIRGVTVVAGYEIDQWRATLPNDLLTAAQVDQAWQAVREQVRRRDEHDRAISSPPLSLSRLLVRGYAAVAAALAAGYLLGWSASRLHSITGDVIVLVGMIVVGLLFARLGRLPYLAWGWLAGVALAMTYVVVRVAWSVLHLGG